jgi:hypothetical protein
MLAKLFLAWLVFGRGRGGSASPAASAPQRVKQNGTDYSTSKSGGTVTVSRVATTGQLVPILSFDDQGDLHIFRARLTPVGTRDDVFELAMADFKVSRVQVP